jgi:hypothetical protein
MALRYCLRIPRSEKYRGRAFSADERSELFKNVPADSAGPGRFLRFSNIAWYRGDDDGPADHPDELLAQYAFESQAEVLNGLDELVKRHGSDVLRGFGRDPRVSIADAWLPIGTDGGVFGDRSMAHALIGADSLAATGLGEGVNVAIIDLGLDRNWVKATKRGLRAPAEMMVHGWSRFDRKWNAHGKPDRHWHNAGERASEHGHMIARTVLSLAPKARIWDVPLLGDPEVPTALSTATAILNRIRAYKKGGRFNGWREAKGADEDFIKEEARKQPWVIVNAWGVFDTDAGDPGLRYIKDKLKYEYGDHPDHFLTDDARELDAAGIDVVFCAGNCGEPCPDWRCGANDRGTGRGIMGLNAHPAVLSVGAVRVDGVPIAQSSEGPGRLGPHWGASEAAKTSDKAYGTAAFEKPDLCAPSYFRDENDATLTNRGTSAACAVAGGVLAALRSVPGAGALTPAALRDALRETAVGTNRTWDPQLGRGVLNVPAALARVQEMIQTEGGAHRKALTGARA